MAGNGMRAFASWNARWLVSPNTTRGARKKAAIERRLLEGRVVALQETHWDEAAVEVWAGLFAQARVAAAPARPGPLGGPQGGVAGIVPFPLVLESSAVLADGCAVEARVWDPASRAAFRVRSVYFPPGARREALDSLVRARGAEAEPLFEFGDINLDVNGPRGDDEREDLVSYSAYLRREGSVRLEWAGPTRRGGQGAPACLDVAAAPMQDAWQYQVRASWLRDLSDHAMLLATAQAQAGFRARLCCPATMAASLPKLAVTFV